MSTDSLRIVFAGTPDFAACHLAYLLDHSRHEVIAVYSQPDRPAGRGKKLKPSPVKQIALDHGIPVYQPKTLKGAEDQQVLADLNADIMVVVAYGLLLPPAILNTPRLGCINVHASILPLWRGAAPIQRAIEAGDTQTGVTIMQMDEGLDTGDMLTKAYCSIEHTETGGSLHDKLIDIGCPSLLTTLDQLASNSATAEPQPTEGSNDPQKGYAKKINKQEMIIDWQQPASAIERKIRAFNPFPICYTTLGDQRIKIWAASALTSKSTHTPGTITALDKQCLIVSCGEGQLAISELQLPGGKALGIQAIINSKADWFTPGTQLGDY